MCQRDRDLSRRSILEGATAFGAASTLPLSPGALEEVQFGSLYTDIVVPEGHRLAFRVSNAAGGTLGSKQGGDVRILCGSDGSRVNVPVAPLPDAE